MKVSVKGIVRRDEEVLRVRNRNGRGDRYCLPGGGQRAGRTLPEALRRECLEEIGFPVAVVRSECLRDHTAAPYESAREPGGDAHRVELVFECRGSGRGAWSGGAALDSMQVAARRIGLDELGQCRLYAKALGSFLNECPGVSAPAYLGDVN